MPSTTALDTNDADDTYDPDDKPLPPPEASALLGDLGHPVATGTLAQKRVHGGGPRFLKFGRRVSYRPSALRQWVKSKTRELSTTSEAKAA
jgi:hypothetical protein